jgi:hypothetical protein
VSIIAKTFDIGVASTAVSAGAMRAGDPGAPTALQLTNCSSNTIHVRRGTTAAVAWADNVIAVRAGESVTIAWVAELRAIAETAVSRLQVEEVYA